MKHTVISLFLAVQMSRDIPEDADCQHDKSVVVGIDKRNTLYT